jgi:hypothetical protein
MLPTIYGMLLCANEHRLLRCEERFISPSLRTWQSQFWVRRYSTGRHSLVWIGAQRRSLEMLGEVLLDLTRGAEHGPDSLTKVALAAEQAISHSHRICNGQACLFRLDSSLTAQGLPDDQAP